MLKLLSLREMVTYAWGKSPFYRTFWPEHGFTIEQLDDENFWERIPVLSKKDILGVPLSELVGERSEAYHFVSASSGTTEKPFISLQAHSPVPDYYKFIAKRCPFNSVFILRRSTYSFLSLAVASQYFPPGTILVEGDLYNFGYSADIAIGMDMDHLVATPSVALRFADTLEEKGYDLNRVKFLYTSGEPFTKSLFNALRTRFPNAGILNGMGVSELTVTLGHNSSFCEGLFEEHGHNAYHINTDFAFYETIDNTLVITPLHPAPFPPIKYNTGDMVCMYENVPCSCGFKTGTIMKVGARASGASYKIGSAILHKRAIAEALKAYTSLVHEDFEVRIRETEHEGIVWLSLTLVTSPKKEISPEECVAMQEYLEDTIEILPGMNIRKGRINRIIGDFSLEFGDVSGQHIVPPEDLTLD